ncbi:MAG: transposase [Pseudomonadota bacterium]|nr:transposase [Pseudomonadota bacterium]
MARPLRIEFDGAWYHVMNRGQGRRVVFRTDAQREYFLSLLADTTERHNAEWHAYCLMSNHYHLLLRTPEGNLGRIMKHVNGLYTQFYNRVQGSEGPLFRGRYKAILVDADAYWLDLSRYIHRYPLEAGVVTQLPEYRWSSFPGYVGKERVPQWLTTTFILDAIGKRNQRARYAAFVEERPDAALRTFYSMPRISPILGGEQFRDQVLRGLARDIDRPQLREARCVPSLDRIVTATAHQFGIEEAEIWRKTRGRGSRGPARGVAMYVSQRAGDMTLSEIARSFGLASYASAGSSIRSVRQALKKDKALAKHVDCILLDLTP